MSSKENVLIKQRSEGGSDQFTLSPCPVVLCAAPCICVAGRAWWNSVYDVLLNTVNPCLHTVIFYLFEDGPLCRHRIRAKRVIFDNLFHFSFIKIRYDFFWYHSH